MKNLMLTTASIFALSFAAASAMTLTDLDTNADGSADIGEVRAVAPTLTQEEFNTIDADASNGWDDNEIGLASDMLLKHLPKSSGPAVKLELATLDTNGDGSADIGEVRAVSPTVTQEEFNMIDADASAGWDDNEIGNASDLLLAKGYVPSETGMITLDTLDSNGDGSADLQEVRNVAPTVTQDEFNQVDADASAGWDDNEMNAQAQMLLARK